MINVLPLAAPTRPNENFRRMLDAIPLALYVTNAEGIITYYNAAAAEFWGRCPEIGKDEWCGSWRILNTDGSVLPHDKCPMAIALKERRAVRGAEAVAERPDGSRIPFAPLPTPIFDGAGTLTGAVNVLLDISDRRRTQADLELAYAELKQNHDELATLLVASREAIMLKSHLAAIVESSDDAIISKNFFGIITSWNAAAERIYGYTTAEAIGKHISIIVPFDHQDEEYQIIDRIRRGERIDHFQTVRRAKDGSLLNVSISVSPVRDADGKVIGAAKVARLLPD